MNFIRTIMDKLSRYEFNDFFPLNNKTSTTRNTLITVGVYIGILIVLGLILTLLGWVPVLGLILKILSTIVAIYCLVGIVAMLLTYMKYN